jgi:hypothetical protein
MSNDTEDQIRADERGRLSTLLEQNAETIAKFAGDKEKVVGLIALMLRLSEVLPSVAMAEPEAAHRAPCVDGDVCGEVAHCPPLGVARGRETIINPYSER